MKVVRFLKRVGVLQRYQFLQWLYLCCVLTSQVCHLLIHIILISYLRNCLQQIRYLCIGFLRA